MSRDKKRSKRKSDLKRKRGRGLSGRGTKFFRRNAGIWKNEESSTIRTLKH